MLIHHLEAEGVAVEDISLEHECDRIEEGLVLASLRHPHVATLNDSIQPLAACNRVVTEKLDAVDAAHRDERVSLPLRERPAVPRVHHVQLPSEHLGEKVAIAAGGLEEPRVDALGLLFHHVEHGVDLALVRENLAVLLDALF